MCSGVPSGRSHSRIGPARPPHDDLVERLDQPELLRHRDEDPRRHQPPLRVLPAHQRLHAVDPALRQLHLRLEIHQELLLVLQRMLQVHLHGVLFGQRLAHLPGKAHVAGIGFLGVVQGQHGILHERFRIGGALRVGGNAHVARHHQRLAIDAERLGQERGDTIDQPQRRLAAVQQQVKFIGAEAGGQLDAARLALQARRHLHQHAVARLGAVNSVDFVQVIQVQRDQRELAAVLSGALQVQIELADEVLPVRQVGQLIVVRQVAHLRFGALALGDVMGDQLACRRPVIGTIMIQRQLDIDDGAVQPHELQLAALQVLVSEGGVQLRVVPLSLSAGHHLQHRLPQQLLGGEGAEQLEGGRVGENAVVLPAE